MVTVPVDITVWALGNTASNFFKFPVLTSLLMSCANQSLLSIQERTAADLWFSPCIFSFWYSVLWTVAALVSLDSQLHVNSGNLLGSAQFLLLMSEPGNSRQDGTIVGLISFVCHPSGITILHCLMPSVLKTTVSYSCFFFFFLGRKVIWFLLFQLVWKEKFPIYFYIFFIEV